MGYGKYILAGVAGYLVGGTMATLICKKYYNEHNQAILSQATAEMELYYKAKIEKLEKKLSDQVVCPDENIEEPVAVENVEEVITDTTDVDVSEITATNSSLDVPFIKPEETQYHKVVIDESSPEQYPEVAELSKRLNDRTAPFLISKDVYYGDDDPFYSDTKEYEKKELIYYTKDYWIDPVDRDKIDNPVLYNIDDERVVNTSDMFKFIGVEWKRNFGDCERDYGADEVIVRNPLIKTDFFITRVDEYYKVEVLGMAEDDPYEYNEVRQ